MKLFGSRALPTILRVAVLPLLAFVALGAWALSSPVGASPDEDYHLDSIWCGQGLQTGVCEQAAKDDERKVPASLVNAPGCFAFHPETSAGCQAAWFGHEATQLQTTSRGNFDGNYPPVFYFTMKFFVGHDISRSVVAMRLVNAALFVGLLTATYWLLPRRRRMMLLVGTGVALVPLGVFIIPSINPSSWAVTSAALVFPALVGFFETAGRRRAGLAVLATVATGMAAGARADAAIYAALAVVLATFLALRWHRAAWRSLLLPAALCAVSLFSYVSSGQSSAASVGLDGSTHSSGFTVTAIARQLLDVPALWAGALGQSGLGWLDTALPALVWVVGLATFGAVVFLGIRHTTRRKWLAVAAALGAAWFIPAVIQIQSSAAVGSQVQPRYILPLLILLAEVALFRVASWQLQMSKAQLFLAAAALAVTNAVSLHTDFRRYLTGIDVGGINLDSAREWWWAVPVSPMTLWLIGSVAFAAVLVLCVPAVLRDEDDASIETLAGEAEAPLPVRDERSAAPLLAGAETAEV